MKEKLFTIPVNNAFSKDCECPLCEIYNELENNNIEYTLSSSYMEKDIRNETNKNGFCLKHCNLLYLQGIDTLNGSILESFIKDLNKVTIDNLKRFDKDLDWYIDKFDYRYKDEPWKNSKDAIERTITKTKSIFINKTTK